MPNLKRGNVAHVATFFNFKLKKLSNKKFKPSTGRPGESMGKQKIRDLRYYTPAASSRVNLKEAQRQAYNLLDFVFDNKDKFHTRWHDKYSSKDKKLDAYTELAALMAKPGKTVYDIAEKLDELIRFKGEEDFAGEALKAQEKSFKTSQKN